MTADGLSRILAVLREEFAIEFSQERAGLWQAVLRDMTDDEGVQCLELFLRRGRFAPHPADLLLHIDEVRAERRSRAPALADRFPSGEELAANREKLAEMARELAGKRDLNMAVKS